jgi:hypothetical protein
MRLSQFAAAATLTTLLAAGAARADMVLFDNASAFESGAAGASGTTTGSTPNSFMGDGYQLLTGATQITGFDLFPVNITGTNFTSLRVTVYLWDNVNTSGTINAATPAFSNLLATQTVTLTDAFNTGFFYPIEDAAVGVPGFVLTTPVNITDDVVGLTFNYQGSTDGMTYTSLNALTSLITFGGPASIGANMFNGYYRNAAGEVDGNFSSTLRSLGVANQSLAVRIYGVPTPGATALLALGGLMGLRRRRA